MKIFIYFLIAAAVGIIAYNATKLDLGNLFVGDSSIALFGVLSGLCAILVLSIFLISQKIAAKLKK